MPQHVRESLLSERIHLAEGLMSGTENSQGHLALTGAFSSLLGCLLGTPRHMPPPTKKGLARQGPGAGMAYYSLGSWSPAFLSDPPCT